MLKAIVHWAVPLFALLVIGPLAGWLTSSLRAPDGGHDATLLVCTSVSRGLISGLAALALAGGTGLLAARIIGARSGLFCTGLVLAWAAWGTGRIDAVLRRTQSASTLYAISLEGLLVGAAAVVIAAAIIITARKPTPPHHDEPRELFDKSSTSALIVGLIAAAIAVWLLAQETLKGQTIAAAAVAGVAAATAGRLASQRTSAVTFFAAIALLATASPALATFLHHSNLGPMRAAQAGTLFALARPLPLDWIAGAFLGIPLGLSWAGSMLEKHTPV